MLARLAIATVLVARMASPSSADVEIHVTCAEDVASDPAHEELLRTTLQRSLGARTDKVVVDVAIVTLRAEEVGRQLRVHVEVRGVISGARGARAAARARAAVTGGPNERAAIERDAIIAAGEQLAATLGRS